MRKIARQDYEALGSTKNTSISSEGGMEKRGMGSESGRVTRKPDCEGWEARLDLCVRLVMGRPCSSSARSCFENVMSNCSVHRLDWSAGGRDEPGPGEK